MSRQAWTCFAAVSIGAWVLLLGGAGGPGYAGTAASGEAAQESVAMPDVPDVPDGARQGPRPRISGRWEARLEALTPMSPRGYFELAEEIADSDPSLDELELARLLFAMSGRLDPAGFGRSACIAMADIESNEERRKQQHAMAALLDDPPLHLPSGSVLSDIAGTDAVRAVLEAFGHVRQGRMSDAAGSAARADTDGIIDAAGPLLPGGAARFRGYLRSTSLGPGMRGASPYTTQEVTRMLVVESLLLGGAQSGRFGMAVLASGDAPMPELDVQRLGDVLVCDPSRPWYRNGAWHAGPPTLSGQRR